jgi:arylsulfatase
MLKKAGYRTGLVGKWGLGAPMSAGLPSKQGFDYFYGFIGQRQDHTYYPPHLWESLTLHGTPFRVPLNNKVISPQVSFPKHLNPLDPKNYRKYRQKDYAPKLLLQAALKFIESSHDQPFFLYYPSPLPHVSLQAPQKWVNYYHKKFGDEKPFLGGSYYPSRYPRATYAAMVSTLDEQVGAIVKKLKELGLYKNTLIVFSSDNGPTHNGGSDSPWFDSGGPFKSKRGWGKGYVHEGGIRIPLIAEWPGKIQSNTHSDLISANWDAMPTLCRIAGVKPPRNIQGISYLPTLLGHPKRQKKHPYLYWEFPGYGGQQAVRKGKWKGIRMHIEKGNLKIQLFNLDKDIQEQHDVADQHPRIVEKIKRIMQQEHTTPAVDAFRMKALERGKSS